MSETKLAKRAYMRHRHSLAWQGTKEKTAEEIARLRTAKRTSAQKRQRTALDDSARCAFYLTKKRRRCAQPRLASGELCGNHAAQAAAAAATREVCAHCGTLIRTERAARHLTVCGVVRERNASESRTFYCAGANRGEALGGGAASAPLLSTAAAATRRAGGGLADATPRRFAEAIWRAFAAHVEGTIVPAPVAERADGGESVGGRASVIAKHAEQERALVGIILRSARESASADASGARATLFAEFGAGKGMLSLALREAHPDARVVLIEREGGSGKSNADRVLRRSTRALFERVRIDIRDFDLAEHPLARDADTAGDGRGAACDVVAISKHLCGAATDLALRCLVNFRAAARAEASAPPIRAAAIALCCHGLCDYETYVAKEWLLAAGGIDRAGFDRMKRSAAWATLKQLDDAAEAAAAGADDDALSRAEMRRVGWCCKRILDAGRVRWLRAQCPELSVELEEYCDARVTPENVVLRAMRRPRGGGEGEGGGGGARVERC
jgi:tRNA:m4X modification enzyme